MSNVFVEYDGRTDFNKYPDHPDCKCGRSSRWYSGVTEENTLPTCGHTTKEFTCIFCLSGFEEGSPEAIAQYGPEGGKHTFLKVLA